MMFVEGWEQHHDMLSENDVHWITGFLYLVARRTDISLVLGERVLDVASETPRDVDIVIASSGTVGFVAVEVKDKGRPLDVGIIEAICQKYADMPLILTRHIVSGSGYTEPARRKAKAHSVECLGFKRGSIPPFQTINLSHLRSMAVLHLHWLEGPHVRFIASDDIVEFGNLPPDTPVEYETLSTDLRATSLKDLADRVAAGVTTNWEGPPSRGITHVQIPADIDDGPYMRIAGNILSIARAEVTGRVELTEETIPLNECCYLETEGGAPFAAAALIQLRTGLFGLSVSSVGQELRLFHIPECVRNVRPTRIRLSGQC